MSCHVSHCNVAQTRRRCGRPSCRPCGCCPRKSDGRPALHLQRCVSRLVLIVRLTLVQGAASSCPHYRVTPEVTGMVIVSGSEPRLRTSAALASMVVATAAVAAAAVVAVAVAAWVQPSVPMV